MTSKYLSGLSKEYYGNLTKKPWEIKIINALYEEELDLLWSDGSIYN